MAYEKLLKNITNASVDISTLLFSNGARILYGEANPEHGVTGKGRAGPGSLYICTSPDSSYVAYNIGTKQFPIWTS